MPVCTVFFKDESCRKVEICGLTFQGAVQRSYYIPEKNPYTLSLERLCNKSLYLNGDIFIAL